MLAQGARWLFDCRASVSEQHGPWVDEEVAAVIEDKAPVGPLLLDAHDRAETAPARPVVGALALPA